MSEAIFILVSGIITGTVYAVFAAGLSLVYGTSRILNFAYGSFYMMAAYLAWFLVVRLELNYAVAAMVLLPALFLIGLVVDHLVIRRLRQSENWKLVSMMGTLGLALILDNAALVAFGPEQRSIPPISSNVVQMGPMFIGVQEIAIFFIAIVAIVALELFLRTAPLGQAMRAVSQDMQGASMVGIGVDRVFAVAFGLSLVLVGIAALTLSPVTLVSPQAGWPLFLKAFVIVVFGGLGSINGALIAALILGVTETAVIYYLGTSWTMLVWLLVLVIVLMVRPKGLLGVWGV
ncbi:branched-chain amino acid ABC transporter permease [Aquibium sp. A9E412]|uniref:branched-chain amino acid ABC transporter permease n=1 Tax=Aquibium sp. A9E412 TaxID=2976767 RepID=UPI0025B1AE18|nr:branched-chain amino acid ABC transporter permease [Aquibium sp. A9E412]MDN2565758.1 branched-chain amino acid ABC transporter permease [Aquibium sp. A9E412]